MSMNQTALLTPEKVEAKQLSGHHLEITLAPFEPGMAQTMGVMLRRYIHSTLGGSAVTAVNIPQVTHEFSFINGMKQDTVELLMNIKEIACSQVDQSEIYHAKVEVKGPCTVTAGDIECPAGLTIHNPDHVLCEITEDVTFSMTMMVEYGRGYCSASEVKQAKSASSSMVDTIFLDASFSPIRKVSFAVESARVGKRTNLDKLVLNVQTNGAITPEEIIKQSATTLQQQLSAFVSIDQSLKLQEEVHEKQSNPILSMKVETLDLAVRAANCLKAENVYFIGDLVSKTELDLLRTPNLGRKSLAEIKAALEQQGLFLGMDIQEWQRPDVQSKGYLDLPG